MEAAGCCLIIIVGMIVWVFFAVMVGALPALGLMIAYMLWSTGQRDFAIVALIVSLMSGAAGLTFFNEGFRGQSTVVGFRLYPIVFVAAQAALPFTLIVSLVILRIRRGFYAPEIAKSVNAIIWSSALVILFYVIWQIGFDGDYGMLWSG